jgi:hypothetical protein
MAMGNGNGGTRAALAYLGAQTRWNSGGLTDAQQSGNGSFAIDALQVWVGERYRGESAITRGRETKDKNPTPPDERRDFFTCSMAVWWVKRVSAASMPAAVVGTESGAVRDKTPEMRSKASERVRARQEWAYMLKKVTQDVTRQP